ncbi:MAG TPA: class I SAM-dependent methyltransferase, partial [Candidatus Limnocylindria bacterium]|nr:class I SAM-dependent methyltransferase [Candidatus Limnocylindria bacterium]
MNDGPIDLAAIQVEIRERVQRKRANGAYSDDVRAALELPLPGGRALFSDELGDPLPALQDALADEATYDATSHRRFVGGAITLGRRAVIGLVRWWIAAITDRQERINQLLTRAVIDLREAPSPQFDERLARLEREWRRWRQDEVAATLESTFFAARFSGDEPVIRRQSEAFIDLFARRTRVLDLGSGRGTFLELLRDKGIGGYGVDVDPKMTDEVRSRGLEAYTSDALEHLRSLGEASLDGLYSRHVAEHILPGELVAVLRECRRVLEPGSPIVFITPNPATLTVGAHTFWLDPSHRRPIPPELFSFYLEVEGYQRVETRTSQPSETRLNEDVPAGAVRENVKLLNATLFGDRDY